MRFALRSAHSGDVPAMHRIRLAVEENRLSDPARLTEACYAPYVEAGCAWVAEGRAGIAGFAALDLKEKSVWALFVAPGAQGAGIGRALHEAMLDHARRQGVDALWLSTGRGTRAQRFYERAGWREDCVTAEGDLVLRRIVGG